ncbi:MAG: rhodanese-like domain-containing protein [Myxococcota bacterium]
MSDMTLTVLAIASILAVIAVVVVLQVVGPTRLGGKNISIDGDRARALVADGAVLLDVRTPGEFASGHLDHAINIPLQQLQKRHSEVPQGPVVLYCQSGIRSARAAAVLHSAGREEIYDLGRMSSW